MTVFEQCDKFLLNGTLLYINNTPTDLSNIFKLKKVFKSPKSRRRRLVNTSFYYISIPKQSESKIWKD